MASIFEPARLGGQVLRNRLMRSATWMATADDGGYVTDAVVKTYRDLAEGGIGGIVTGMVSVSPVDALLEGQLRLDGDRFVEGHKRIADAAHEFGVPVIMVGGHRSVGCMQESLDRSGAAFLSLSRPLIREPRLVRRWMEGDLRPSECVSCNRCYETPGHECYFNLKKIGGKK